MASQALREGAVGKRFQVVTVVATMWVLTAGSPIQERVERVTSSQGRSGLAALSPDGRQLAFISNRSGSWQVWLSEPDGSGPWVVTDEDSPVGWPAWDSSGDTLFYYTGDGVYRLRTIVPSRGESADVATEGLSAFRPILHPTTPDRLLFDAVDLSGGGDHDLVELDRQRGTWSRLTTHPGYDSDARWSPDGTGIVFQSDRGHGQYHTQLYVLNTVSRELRQLTDGLEAARYPSWSPNGRCIVYAADDGDGREIWVMNADGSDAEQLTDSGGFNTAPTWSHPGRLYFSTDRYGGEEIALLRVRRGLADRCEA